MDLQSEDKICRKNEEQRPCRKGAGLLPFRAVNGLWRTLLVVLTIGLGATACKDDDDEQDIVGKQEESKTLNLHVDTAGTLPKLIGEESKYTITDLTLSGKLNGTDILFLREMAGAGLTQDVNTPGVLRKLDLTNARIVEGGDYYYQTNALYPYCYTKNDTITAHMFYHCNNLIAIDLPKGVKYIGNWAFCGCSRLISINLPEGVTRIGIHAFSYCRNLTSIDLPEGITSIGYNTFYNCSSLKDMYLKASVPPEVESGIFNYSSNCTLHIPKGSLAAYRQSPAWDEVWSQFKEIIEE